MKLEDIINTIKAEINEIEGMAVYEGLTESDGTPPQSISAGV